MCFLCHSIDFDDVPNESEPATPQKNLSQEYGKMFAIYADDKKRVWFRAGEKLIVYSVEKQQITKVLDSTNGINSLVYGIHQTSDGLWLTTRSDGVIQLDEESPVLVKKQARINTAQPLSELCSLSDRVMIFSVMRS